MEITHGNDQVKNSCVCNEVPVEEIVRYARNEPILVGHYLPELATLLNIPTENTTQFEPNGVVRDRLTFILQMWISRTGSSATVESFISTLLVMKLVDLAELIGQTFNTGWRIVNMRSCKCAQSTTSGQHSSPPLQPFTYNAQHFGASSTIYQVAYQQPALVPGNLTWKAKLQ